MLIEEMTMTKKEVAEAAGVSYTLLNRFENGSYTGKKLRQSLAKAARKKAAKFIELADDVESEAA